MHIKKGLGVPEFLHINLPQTKRHFNRPFLTVALISAGERPVNAKFSLFVEFPFYICIALTLLLPMKKSLKQLSKKKQLETDFFLVPLKGALNISGRK